MPFTSAVYFINELQSKKKRPKEANFFLFAPEMKSSYSDNLFVLLSSFPSFFILYFAVYAAVLLNLESIRNIDLKMHFLLKNLSIL